MYSWFQISSYGLSMVNFIKLNYNYEIRSKRTNRKKKDMNKKKFEGSNKKIQMKKKIEMVKLEFEWPKKKDANKK